MNETQVESGLRRKLARLALAGLFAAAGLAAGLWSWQHYRKVYTPPKTPVPVMEYIPVVPKESQAAVASAITFASSLMLNLDADQRAKVQAVWNPPPQSLQELIGKQRQMDKLLTPEQLARLKPVRRMVQSKIVDELFESGRKRFAAHDFERMKAEIKRRVEQRMSEP